MSKNIAIVLICFFAMIPSVSAIIGAIYVMIQGKEGWGWLLFIAAILGSYSVNIRPQGKKI